MDSILQYLAIVWAWCLANPQYSGPALAFVLLTVYSYVPRTPPSNPTLYVLWRVLERFTFLAWDKWGGPFKWIGIVSPDPAQWAKAELDSMARQQWEREGKPGASYDQWIREAETKPDTPTVQPVNWSTPTPSPSTRRMRSCETCTGTSRTSTPSSWSPTLSEHYRLTRFLAAATRWNIAI